MDDSSISNGNFIDLGSVHLNFVCSQWTIYFVTICASVALKSDRTQSAAVECVWSVEKRGVAVALLQLVTEIGVLTEVDQLESQTVFRLE